MEGSVMDAAMLSGSPSMSDPLQLQQFSRQPRSFGGAMPLLPHMTACGQETNGVQQQQQQHHCLAPDPKSIGRNPIRCKPSLSEEDEPSFTEDGTEGQKGKKDSSPWQRMKWTDVMVRTLIAAVLYVGEEGDCANDGGNSSKRKSGILQKKGKWKSVSKLMNSKGYPVSPQQCEDKFNDLNKRYKRLNDVLGRGTACEVVENPALLDTMNNLSDKAKDDVRKILSSKHLFYREMCAYHNGNRIHMDADHGLQHHSGMMMMHHPARMREGYEVFRPMGEDTSVAGGGAGDDNEEEDMEAEDDEEEDEDEDEEENEGDLHIEGAIGETMKRSKMNPNWEDMNFWSPPGPQDFGRPSAQDNLNQDLMSLMQDAAKPDWQKRQWMQTRAMQLEEQKVAIQTQAFELEKQRMKWKRVKSRKDRDLDRLKLQNERMKLENERMALQLKQKELELDFKRSDAIVPLKMERFRGLDQHEMGRGEPMQ